MKYFLFLFLLMSCTETSVEKTQNQSKESIPKPPPSPIRLNVIDGCSTQTWEYSPSIISKKHMEMLIKIYHGDLVTMGSIYACKSTKKCKPEDTPGNQAFLNKMNIQIKKLKNEQQEYRKIKRTIVNEKFLDVAIYWLSYNIYLLQSKSEALKLQNISPLQKAFRGKHFSCSKQEKMFKQETHPRKHWGILSYNWHNCVNGQTEPPYQLEMQDVEELLRVNKAIFIEEENGC